MSDIAPFVAAAIKDKTVAALLEENKRLRETIDTIYSIEITGPEGTPVYARGKLDRRISKKSLVKSIFNPNLWEVELETVETCAFSNLMGIEVRIGGVQRSGFRNPAPNYSYTESNVIEASFDDRRNDDLVRMSFYFNFGRMYLFTKTGLSARDITQSGLPDPYEIWDEIWVDEGGGVDDFLHYLESVSRAKPDASIQFTSIAVSIYDALVPECKQFEKKTLDERQRRV